MVEAALACPLWRGAGRQAQTCAGRARWDTLSPQTWPRPVAETPRFVLVGGAFAGAQDGKLMEFRNVVSKACQLVSIAAELAVMGKRSPQDLDLAQTHTI